MVKDDLCCPFEYPTRSLLCFLKAFRGDVLTFNGIHSTIPNCTELSCVYVLLVNNY